MGHIYLHDMFASDLTTIGVCGALPVKSALFTEEANGDSRLDVELVYDVEGRWALVSPGMLLTARVPVRTTPEISAGSIVTAVEIWTVKATATKDERTLYTKCEGGKKLTVIPGDTSVTVVSKDDAYDRYKVKSSKYGSGWIDKDALSFALSQTIASTTTSIETLEPSWAIRLQAFRVYHIVKDEDKFSIDARHITYDLQGNMTTYKVTSAVSAQTALNGIMSGCMVDHDFTAQTNIADTRTGADWTRVSPINALLDEDDGFVARWECELVRDNYEMYFLDAVGLDRGVRIEFGKNLQGISYDEDWSDIVTEIVPVGKKADGSDLLLTDDGSGDSVFISTYPGGYPTPNYIKLDCSSFATVNTSTGVTVAIARARMLEAAQAKFDEGLSNPKVNVTVKFLQLGDTAEFAPYKNLERLFLYDYASAIHPKIGVNEKIKVSKIEYDPVLERFVGMEMGTVAKKLSTGGKVKAWQS